MCERGHFRLRKWCSNHVIILGYVKNADRGVNHEFNDSSVNVTKTLGIWWNPMEDELLFAAPVNQERMTCTKRNVISEMSKLFDPLGLVGPVIVTAKMFVQDLWRLQIQWDESLPSSYDSLWKKYREDLMALNELRIPRCVIQLEDLSHVQLHIFCDASEKAYGACAYVRGMSLAGKVVCQLLTSKSRVAPVKKVTLPRLELCAALLGARLFDTIKKSWHRVMKINHSILWTDSSITWRWICADSRTRQWKTFVANRVSEIQELTSEATWRHVKTTDNPTDYISRGLDARELPSCRMWWNGPAWLTERPESWPKTEIEEVPEGLLEKRMESFVVTNHEPDMLLSRFSKLERLQRVTAYCLRAVHQFKIGRRDGRKIDPLNAEELERALLFLVGRSQRNEFGEEIEALVKGSFLSPKSKLQSLYPFLDSAGKLRVGGRLQNYEASYDVKHPFVLSASCPFSQLLVDYEHRRLLHAGPQLLLSSLRNRYWILGVRRLVQKRVHECKRCYIWKLKTAEQLMGSLPLARVQPSSAFYICGVDYAGPFVVRSGPVRSKIRRKAYVALFICLATRAIHIELVSDWSSSAFMAALRRFVSRRGCPREINSDNGTNFVGAARELREMLKSEEFAAALHPYVAQTGSRWKFIPPSAPHFGGIWEAGVKAIKSHLRRIVGETVLSFEEFYTLLTQIEAVLNSRPLFAESSEPTDFGALTPGHFLIGKAITAIPEPDYTVITSLKTRWQLIQQMNQHFWKRWSKEYVQLLQQRPKWTKEKQNLQPGRLVLIKEENQPPLVWALGRIQAVHPGPDGLVRVATIKTAKAVVQRPIHKLCPLPGLETDQIEATPQSGASMLAAR